ncbi:oxidoreductase [Embleya sp. NPDC059237]|uniref:oxidoreductase n=1 Tax=Embleya sp. NPDC059237 TaxID=3346784 RepID=UPI0036B3342F
MSVALLVALGMIDAALAGYRASNGRNGRIRRRAADLRAARRGLPAGALVLAASTAVALAVLGATDDHAARYAELDAAAWRMLAVLLPYAGIVAASMLCYLAGSFRLATFAILAGLGPLTMARPLIVAGGIVAAGWGTPAGAAVAATAGSGILLVEPYVHRRWYRTPI